jgi:hypothetical protein
MSPETQQVAPGSDGTAVPIARTHRMVSPRMSTWQGYRDQSHKFLEVARIPDPGDYPSQVVSSAVLAAVAANDALGVLRTGQAAGDHAHADIIWLLDTACRGTPLEPALPQRTEQLRRLLAHEQSALSGETLSEGVAREVMADAADFIGWVEGILSARA